MKSENKCDKDSIKKYSDFSNDIGLGTEEARRYYSGLGVLHLIGAQKKQIVLLESGVSSTLEAEIEYAGLDRNTE